VVRSVYYFTDSQELGGAEHALLLLLEHIDRRHWQPTLLYNASAAMTPVAERAQELGAHVRAVPSMPLGLTGGRRVPAFARELRRQAPDVFHAHLRWPLAAKYPLLAAVLARVPAIVATVHLYPDVPIDRSNRLQERLLAAHVARYIAVSEDIATRLVERLRWPEDKIEVIHNGVPVERLQRPVDPDLRRQLTGGQDRPVLLSTARLVPQKGLEVLLRAAAQVNQARLVLAGEGPERAKLESEAAALGVADRVVFLGYRNDVPELLAACDVFVLPSLYEGTSLSLLEAMAAGKPVITSAIPGTDEVVVDGETGLLVRPGDVDGLVAALRRVLAEPLLRARLGAAARKRAEERSSTSIAAESVFRLYEHVLVCEAPDGGD
jgi:glycosyltransferase involved in cell wall biosynthesis